MSLLENNFTVGIIFGTIAPNLISVKSLKQLDKYFVKYEEVKVIIIPQQFFDWCDMISRR